MQQTWTAIPKTKIWAPFIPYITISFGLLVLHNAWISILAYHLGMTIALILAKDKPPLRQSWRSSNRKILIVTAVFGGMGGLLLYIFWPLLGIPENIIQYLQNIGLTATTWPYFMAYFVTVNPWLEEYFWRGYLGSDSKGIILNDLLFSGYHILVMIGTVGLIWVIVVFVALCLGAWFWRQVNRWNQGLSASVISHVVADASVISVIFIMVV